MVTNLKFNATLSLTAFEEIGLRTELNMADGHAYQDLAPEFREVLKALPQIWNECLSTTIPEMEKNFMASFSDLIGSPGLQTYPHYSISPTASNSIDITAAWLRAKRFRVGLLEPTFDNLALLLRRREVPLVSIDEGQIRKLIQLQSTVSANGINALFLVNPNNPTGSSLSRDEFVALVDWCRKTETVLILDRTFRLFVDDGFDDYQILFDAKVSFICIEDTGKSLPTLDMKASPLVCSPDIAAELKEIFQEIYLSSSIFTLAVLRNFLIVAKKIGLQQLLWDVVQERRDALRGVLKESGPFVPAGNAKTKLSVEWVDISHTGMNDLEVCQHLQRAGVSVLSGRYFYWNSSEVQGHNYIRVAMMKPKVVFEKSLAVLESILRDWPTARKQNLVCGGRIQ